MRTAAAAVLVCCVAAAPATAFPRELAGVWRGTWTNPAMGTHGGVRLVTGRVPALRLGGPALGCAEPTLLPVRYREGRLTGRGHDVPCNEGLRWTFRGRLAQARIVGTLALRLADGSRATVAVELRRRR
jgi:hypothetical protein